MDGKKRLVMLVNFSQLMNARWLRRLSDLIQRHRTSLKYHHRLYAREESVFAALREKLKGIKQKLSSVIVIAASAAVSGYDFITPIVSGVDVSSIAAQVPSWAWPIVLICITALFQ
jgi:hypothetical protein